MRTALLAAACLPAALAPLFAPRDASPTPEAAADQTADEAAVRAAVEDYVLAFYDAEPERLARALSPDLEKLGYWRNGEAESYGDATHMSYDEAVALATRWNADGQYGDDIAYEITLYDVADQTACAKLDAYWGHDYLQLAKEPDGWRIHHILWQGPPQPRSEADAPSPDTESSTQSPMQTRYLELVTPDVDATCAALERLHGVTFGEPVPELGNARTATRRGGDRIGVRAPLRDTETPVVRPYFLVDDVAAATEAAVAAGAELAMAATEIPGQGTFAIYVLGGNQVGLWQD